MCSSEVSNFPPAAFAWRNLALDVGHVLTYFVAHEGHHRGQLVLLAHFWRLVRAGSQLLVATHSPILMGYPEATIFQLDGKGIAPVPYEDTDHYQVTRAFLLQRGSFFKHLLDDD